MAGEVVAAWIAAGASVLGVIVTTCVALWVRALDSRVQQKIADESRELEFLVAGFGHMVGGSQERAAGIATLQALKTVAATNWPDYASAVRQLFLTQIQYVLGGGRNRWERHEIANIRAIADWLMADDLDGRRQDRDAVAAAAQQFANDWNKHPRVDGQRLAKDDGGRANVQAEEHLVNSMKSWKWIP